MPKALMLFLVILLALQAGDSLSAARPKIAIPPDFPTFTVPGQERVMAELRELYWVHYERGGPLATLWDEWMSTPTLWPAVTTDNRLETIRERWRQALLSRGMDEEGYVFTHQHGSIAHQQGWPFPFWLQGKHGWGWHFALEGFPAGWGPRKTDDPGAWELSGLREVGREQPAWRLEPTAPEATLTSSPLAVDPYESPFIQVRWSCQDVQGAQPYLQWATQEHPEFSRERMMHFPPATGSGLTYTMIPVYRHPEWKGTITRLRLGLGNPLPGGTLALQAMFTQFDTRHTINNQNFIRGSISYFRWSGEVEFLRLNIGRMRLALGYLRDELGGLEHKCITVPWVGHEGRPGYTLQPDGSKQLHYGSGIGNNYWDLLPMGYHDAYATIQYYSALVQMADLEREIGRHPEWGIPGGPLRVPWQELARHAREVKATGGKLFWNKETHRFTTGPDKDGRSYDYGFVFLNLEAIHYDFAIPAQARDILGWVAGERAVAGDTSTGADIYHWRFGPRATTRRNVEYYLWAWSGPEQIPWGGQVQDGGAVLGFSYHDLMARLAYLGPDNCWGRVREIAAWYREVQEAGGPREYYRDGTRGTLQGGGTAGGLGIDQEFFESILVPQVMADGFLGMRPRVDGLAFAPRLPRDWPSLGVTGIHWHGLVFDVEATNRSLAVKAREGGGPACILLPGGDWQASVLDAAGKELGTLRPAKVEGGCSFGVDWGEVAEARFARGGKGG